MGSFGSFLYINGFFGDESRLSLLCPSVKFACVAVCMWVALNRRVPELQVGFGAPGLRFRSPGDVFARETAGRPVSPCIGFQLHTTEGGQAKSEIFLAILHILDARAWL